MTTNRDQWADGLSPEHSGGWLSGFLAEEDEFDRRTLWRLGSWGIGSIAAVTVALYANQTSSNLRRDQMASADLARQAQQIQWVAKESQSETRRLASAIDTLNSDRDRLYARVAVVEQGLDSVTGSIKQNASASPPPTTAGPNASTSSNASSSNATPTTSPSTASNSTSTSSTSAPSTSASTTAQPASTDAPTMAPPGQPSVATSTIPKTVKPPPTEPVTASAGPTTTTAPPPTTAGPTTATVAPTTQNGAIQSSGPPLTEPPKSTATVPATSASERPGAIVGQLLPQIPSTSPLTNSSQANSSQTNSSQTKSSQTKSSPSEPASSQPAIAAKPDAQPNAANGQQVAALMPPKSIMAPPDPAATKLTEPEKPATSAPAVAQPQKADTAPAVAEPEADEKSESPAIPVQRTQFGIDLGGANSVDGLRALWRGLLKYRANKALADLQPLIVVKERSNGLGMQLRLVAGPIGDAAAAAKLCAVIADSNRSCETTVYDGQRLAMVRSDTGSSGESSKSDTSPPPTAAPAERERPSSRSSHRRGGSSKRAKPEEVSEKDTAKPPAPRSTISQFLGLR